MNAFASGPQDAELTLFAEWWTRFDPEAAYGWARALDKRTGLSIRLKVLRTWARKEPSAALAVASSSPLAPGLRGPSQGQSFVSDEELAILAGWNESLIPGIEDWIFEHETIQRQMLIQVLAQNRVATRGPEAAWEWAGRLGAAESKAVLMSVAAAIAGRDPDEAVRLATPLLSDGSLPELAPRIAIRWSRRDPRAAFGWLATTPPGPARESAAVECARNWITVDRPGFYTFMEEHSEELPKWLEPAFGLYARGLTRDGRAGQGLDVVSRFRSEELRSYNTTLILRHWLSQDREAASRWIEDHEIPEPVLRRAGYRGDGP